MLGVGTAMGSGDEMAADRGDKKRLKVGKDSVVMGNVPDDIDVGDGSVVIGATDSHGNTILNQPMAVGRGAKAGPGSIAIGAGAGAGFDIVQALRELERIANETDDAALIEDVAELRTEVESEKSDKSRIRKLWDRIKGTAALASWASLAMQVSQWIASHQ